MISRGSQPRHCATVSRAASRASLACCPGECRLEGLAKISGDKVVLEESGTEDRSPKTVITEITRKEYFKEHFWYHLKSHPVVVENGEEKITRTFEEWYKYIGVEQMVGYDREILNEVSVKDLKKFFLPELKAGYKELLDIATKKGGEEDEE